jgi:GDP-mannose 6-dehydrogenase
MKVSIFGVGYVGAVVSACMADAGHEVVAVDINEAKVESINGGHTPISEPGIAEIITRAVAAKQLRATADAEDAIRSSDLTFVCVGTPSRANGDLDLDHLLRACTDIARALRNKSAGHMLVVRSTVLPGTMDGSILPLLADISGRRPGDELGVAYYPEFMREGSAIQDFNQPATAVIGRLDEATTQILKGLNRGNGAALHIVDMKTAEAVKYASNAWHALKVSFANEIGTISKASGLDGKAVMAIVCADRKLNISAAYLRPGFAFGGSCLPKDLRALRYHAKRHDVPSLVLDATLEANQQHIERAVAMIARTGKRRVAMLGLTFKPETDDLRESPLVELAERLIGKGFDLAVYDRDLEPDKLVGRNRQFALEHLPHLSRLLVNDLDEVIARSDVIVIGTPHSVFVELLPRLRSDQHVVDLAGHDEALRGHPHYEGACW